MGKLKQIVFFLSFILLGISISCIFFWDDVAQWFYQLRQGYGEREYIQIAAGTNGSMCAAYWDSPNQIGLRFFDANGENIHDWVPILPEEAEAGYLAALYPVGNKTAFLVIYEENSSSLNVYRTSEGQTAERLLHREIDTTKSEWTARRNFCRIGSFSRQQDEIRFTLIESWFKYAVDLDSYVLQGIRSGTITGYACSATEGGLRELGKQKIDRVVSGDVDADKEADILCQAIVLPNGELAFAGAEGLIVEGMPLETNYPDSRISQMAVSGSTLYFFDSATGVVSYTDLSARRVQDILQVQRSKNNLPLTSIVLAPTGDMLMLESGWKLTRFQPGGVSSLSGALNPSLLHSVFMLSLLVLGSLLFALAMGYLFFVVFRGNVSMAVYWSFVFLSVAMSLAVYLHYDVMLPDAVSARADQLEIMIRSVIESGENPQNYADETGWVLYGSNVNSLEDLHFPSVHAADQIVAIWSEEKQDYFTWKGEPAELIPGFSSELADRARQSQDNARQFTHTQYATAFGRGDVTVTFVLKTDTGVPTQSVEKYVNRVITILMFVAVAILLLITQQIRTLGKGLERYSRQEPWKRLNIGTADELEGIASSLNSMAADREMEERNRNRLVESYHRFVPERVLSLLGRNSILEVDKSTYSSQEMALLMVWFAFPESVYSVSANSRLLFDSVNAVIERTAPIATRQGGTVFNFGYDGYDVVMENDPARAVSLAVSLQQEVLAFNESRLREGLPTVTFRIALDVGNVLFGIVGDSSQMQPTASSSCFSTTRELLTLCGQLESGILCTEAIAPGLKQYGSRFIGKKKTREGTLRVYEVFDGDPYEMRKEKETTLKRFSQAVMAFYSGDASQAKRIFLELAHEAPRDGGARHYLYLADRMDGSTEHPESLSL